jgi:hypothetical protein
VKPVPSLSGINSQVLREAGKNRYTGIKEKVMAQTKEVMPIGDQLDLLMKFHELEQLGKTEEAAAVKRQIPLPYYMAKVAKDHLGAEFVLNLGWSLAEAEAVYGQDWLTR